MGDALISLVRDLEPVVMVLISVLCWIAGLFFIMSAAARLVRSASDGLRGPSKLGTLLTVVLAVAMFGLPEVLSAGGLSLFGQNPGKGLATLAYVEGGEKYDEVLWAVFAIIQVIGVWGVAMSFFVWRDAADGRQGATAGKGAAHFVGGMLGWHILPFLDALQRTLGIEPLKIIGVVGPATT